MGLDKSAADILCGAKFLGADFSIVATIGRQSLVVPSETIAEVAELHGVDPHAVAGSEYAEPFLHMLGAHIVESFDASDYEGATHIVDMNEALPVQHRSRYSLVFDGGALEHVFNAPQAFRNCMEMLKEGGTFVQVSNANNLMGHGFWQFCPEIMYRVFSADNGFEILTVLLQTLHQPGDRRFVERHRFARDPLEYGRRVELRNCRRTYIITVARKCSERPIFANWPQQSNYVSFWSAEGRPPQPQMRAQLYKRMIRAVIPLWLE